MSTARIRRSLLASLLAAVAAVVGVVVPSTAAQAAPVFGCHFDRTVQRTFDDFYNGTGEPKLFTVQFTNLDYCFNGQQVYWYDNPQFRIYIDGRYATQLQGACAGVSKSDTNVRLTSVYVTCNAVFSNKGWGTYPASARGAINDSSKFTIPALLNAGVNLGALGFVGSPGVADISRYFTLRVGNTGCWSMSGIGNPTTYCG